MSNLQNMAKFIVIDDEMFNNMICEFLIAKVYPDADIVTFTEPAEGIEYLKAELSNHSGRSLIILLDIDMPAMTAWEFMEELQQSEINTETQPDIYILSSSVNPADMENTKKHKLIKGFVEKPLTEAFLRSL